MSNPEQTSQEVRDYLVEALQLDLVGPTVNDDKHAQEVISKAPSVWYLTGFLIPHEAPTNQRFDEMSNDELDEVKRMSPGDDENTPEAASARRAFFPSSMGLSFLVPPETKSLNIYVNWGNYTPIYEDKKDAPLQSVTSTSWQRSPYHYDCLDFDIHENTKYCLPNSNGVKLVLLVKEVSANNKLPAGTRAVSLFLVNERNPVKDDEKDCSYIFQAKLTVKTNHYFVPRPDLREQVQDEDERIADLQYRHDYEFAVGHNVSCTSVKNDVLDSCSEISTAWIPSTDVEKVAPSKIDGVELGMESLAAAVDANHIRNMLGAITSEYGDWIENQRRCILSEPNYIPITQELLDRATKAKERINSGLRAFDDPLVLESFRITNRAIATSIRQRICHGSKNLKPKDVDAPEWRPFQLAFLLMNIVGIADPTHQDRQIVDLLFFPTGGGKTEAYLGLAAFTMVLRRLRNPGTQYPKYGGLSVLMRYTLRLLTLDQLGRAATLICALELEREKNKKQLGEWPFEIGLWVGQAATPNRMGKKGDNDDNAARSRVLAYKNSSDKNKSSPVPLENCPWCGTKFERDSFNLIPNVDQPTDLRITCMNRECSFTGDRPLPILTVDDVIYRRLPAFMIATVDKFANLPWVGETAALFGKVNYFDKEGFYSPASQTRGQPIENLPPIDLVIQDELHLISGPLGTMVGLYETVIDYLSSYKYQSIEVRSKIIASTATVRRATDQIRSLFGRKDVEIFPPPGPNRNDSFFAQNIPTSQECGRKYIGIAAQGRSLKVILMHSYLALLGAAKKAWKQAGGEKTIHNPADPYMTLLGYFNSLRELGGSRRIIEDQVRSRLEFYENRKRENESKGLFSNRIIADVPLELTSRVSTSEVANAKSKLAQKFTLKNHLDTVLATNMISVGLDITRLGLMVVLGQPKTVSEYIQATSRVGRDSKRPGLVVTLLNIHRPRDRSYYERFEASHNTFYKAVEATSVTPFSPRAIDRGLAAITVAIARLGDPEMTAALNAVKICEKRDKLGFVVDTICQRAEIQELDKSVFPETIDNIEQRVNQLLNDWMEIANEKKLIQYQKEEGKAPPLLFNPLDPELEELPVKARQFKAQRSLREIEPTVNLWVVNQNEED
ncbi:MAG: DISARM system helicase DrmA [Cyanobacteria bacterium REEB494]|nr:DISARM system helicase DrmA [Cyanobacteria bacterium REEB494]